MSGHYRNYKDVLHKLESIPMFGRQGKSAANFSLEPIRNFCEKLGNPQNKFRSVHVAGTNGKGTTCRMLASVYQEAGYRTGLYTSPHLADYRERFTVNSKWIPKQYLLRFFQEHSGLIESHKLTYFELSTAVAYWYFSEMETDVAILETGLGGRLDATNIVKPMVTVITSVGLDHTDLLGDTVEMIAAEKAGIIKPNTPVVAGQVPE
ncbi:MAG: Mur ligase family protein, partial [Balneolaceae bacterium]